MLRAIPSMESLTYSLSRFDQGSPELPHMRQVWAYVERYAPLLPSGEAATLADNSNVELMHLRASPHILRRL